MLTTVASGRTYDFSHAVGGNMPQPVALACGSGDTVYALSRQYEQVLDVPWNKSATFAYVMTYTMGPEWGDEEKLGNIGRYGDAEGELIWPAGLALDASENIYVTDEWMNRVTKYSKEGDVLSVWGSEGSGNGEFNRPSGIAIDSNGDLYISDSMNHRVQKFSPEGKFILTFGSQGSGEGELNAPWGLTIDNDGAVYVADHKNHRVQKFSSDGTYLACYGAGYGDGGKGQMNRPSDVAVDPDGDIYVTDWGNDRVQIYSQNGRFIATLIGDAQELAKGHKDIVDSNADVIKARRRVYSLEPEWRFSAPTALTFDIEKSRLIVADTHRGRVQIYNKLNDYMEPQFNL